MAAMETLNSMVKNGPIAGTAMRINKKDAPHQAANKNKDKISFDFIKILISYEMNFLIYSMLIWYNYIKCFT